MCSVMVVKGQHLSSLVKVVKSTYSNDLYRIKCLSYSTCLVLTMRDSLSSQSYSKAAHYQVCDIFPRLWLVLKLE